jgi:hypothetical protein
MLLTVEISQREVQLLLRYGYPFDDVRAQLESFKTRKGPHSLQIDSFYLPRLTADLVYSAKKIRSRTTLHEIDELCSVLDHAQPA